MNIASCVCCRLCLLQAGFVGSWVCRQLRWYLAAAVFMLAAVVARRAQQCAPPGVSRTMFYTYAAHDAQERGPAVRGTSVNSQGSNG